MTHPPPVMLLHRFTFEYAYHKPEEQCYKIVSHPKHGVHVKVHRR